ncbi:MAG: nitroreductase family protein [Propionibacteriaceae bacterium]|jgi:nitroreductase|nr:nitroreductase family protein [Propionibacteriaceae bacterium]
MDTLEAIRTRYACRNFDGNPIPADTLRAIAEAGLAAPSAMNHQPWLLLVLKDKPLIEELDKAGMDILAATDPATHERMMGRGGRLFYGASGMIVILQKTGDTKFTELDCGIVTANLTLAARALGVDSVVCGFAGVVFEGDSGAANRERLGFPPGYDFALAVLFGYSAGPAGQPHAIDPSKIIEI